MKIKEMLQQSRRDFWALFECQFCGHVVEKRGYDDTFYHQRVIPDMKCPKCQKSVTENADEMSEIYEPQATKYPDGLQV